MTTLVRLHGDVISITLKASKADFHSASNATHPNLCSRDIFDLLYSKTGAHPFIRVGGTPTWVGLHVPFPACSFLLYVFFSIWLCLEFPPPTFPCLDRYPLTGPLFRRDRNYSDRAWYNASQEIDSYNWYNKSSPTDASGIADRVYIGPAFFEGFANFPGTHWSWQINVGSDNSILKS
ncbi:Glycoside hydrolase family 79 protein [Penicillium cataractarum]|uniref:Glycoside hydrolase family 79 protein n=1 Tax=Penicillium cataractarum TaxID=2100454 RepID=A0A9W9SND9_9EURO|nr:Glycoside hydrolase family 79 protein [Penicillium cataractarum]KAJ5381667.1 Glycoside hydrolase family 79 protein [Penicillium cataractarum]